MKDTIKMDKLRKQLESECEVSYLRLEENEALQSRVEELEVLIKGATKSIGEYQGDNLRLRKALEEIKDEYNNVQHTCQERLNIIGRYLDAVLPPTEGKDMKKYKGE